MIIISSYYFFHVITDVSGLMGEQFALTHPIDSPHLTKSDRPLKNRLRPPLINEFNKYDFIVVQNSLSY